MVNSVTFPAEVGGDGSTVTDDDNISTGLGNGGHLLRFIPCLQNLVAIAVTVVTKAGESLASASSAAGSALAASSSASAASNSASAAATSAADAQPKPILTYANLAAFPAPGASGRVYQALDTAFFYVWDAGAYVRTYHSLSALTIAELNAAVTDADVATTTDVANSGISNIVTATTSTTLTATKTLLQITPDGYGVAVTLPNAMTCALGLLHIIDNRGGHELRVLNSSGTLLGFVPAGVVSHVSLGVKTTSAGVWTIENSVRHGISAQLSASVYTFEDTAIDLGGGRELLLFRTPGGLIYAVVRDAANNTFGAVTLARASTAYYARSVLVSADKVLVVSIDATTGFEAIVLSVSGTTITPGTAATATLSANISMFADGCGLIAVGTSFVTSYAVAGSVTQIRAISVSGTTPTIGAATTLPGVQGHAAGYGALIVAIGSAVICASVATTHLYITPYTVSGSTLSVGTGTDTGGGTMTVKKFALMPSGRCFVSYNDGGSTAKGAFATLSGTTVTISAVTMFADACADAIIVNATKVLMFADNNVGGLSAKILSDSSGTASVGSACALTDAVTPKVPLYVSGNNVVVQEGTTAYKMFLIDCSGANPVVNKLLASGGSNVEASEFAQSDSVLRRSARAIYGVDYVRGVWLSAVTQNFDVQVVGGVFGKITHNNVVGDIAPGSVYRGATPSEVWFSNGGTVITKMECVR